MDDRTIIDDDKPRKARYNFTVMEIQYVADLE